MAKEDVTTLDALTLDGRNFNRHTEQGMTLLEKSLRELGAGRSILVDKDNNIIAGNGIVEAAGKAGITRVRVVEVQGDELVAVKRTDMSLDSPRAGRWHLQITPRRRLTFHGTRTLCRRSPMSLTLIPRNGELMQTRSGTWT